MKYLLKNWKAFLFENKNAGGLLPLDVIDFIIKRYAKNPQGPVNLKRGYFDFNEFGKGFEDTAASYLIPSQMLIVNVNDSDIAQGNIKIMINAILHEIQHYNQHMRWDSGDEGYKIKFSKGFKIPKNVSLEELDWLTITKFWNKIYSYEKRPQEIDAMNFANNNFKQAFQDILEREKQLKNNKKKDTI